MLEFKNNFSQKNLTVIFLLTTFHINILGLENSNIFISKRNIPLEDTLAQLRIPTRNPEAISGSEFLKKVENMTFSAREEEIYNEISTGNIPEFLRSLVQIETTFYDASNNPHNVKYEVMPDYLAIGSDEDFCRIPMGPKTAQKLADLFGAVMPTRKLVDNIYQNAEIKLEPVTYYPVGNANELVPKFVEHNTAIEQQRISAGGILGQIVGGIKKDVVLSNKITDPTRPDHVVIYGWHQLDGNPIQPLTNIHFDTYVDYSHGIRFLNSQILLNGEVKLIEEILTNQTLYKILSDETSIMTQPTYLTIEDLSPEAPKSFGVFSEGQNSITIKIKKKEDVENFVIFISNDGFNFSELLTTDTNIVKIENLESSTKYFFKITAENSYGNSHESEVLSAVTNAIIESKILIVNGFDRTSDGNTFDFIRQHSEAIWNNSYIYESATNDAVIDGIVNLMDYNFVDYILGDESTADETFSNAEQNLIITYLQNGGNLFISGSEIAWDLDYKGSTSDKNFMWNYLKAKYVQDAPNNTQQTYYQASAVPNSILGSFQDFYFDNGTQGTINVKWPDVLKETNGGIPFLLYKGFNSSYGSAGIYFSGNLPNGTLPGKVITMGFPFETIYPEEVRNDFMKEILNFFFDLTDIKNFNLEQIPSKFLLSQNYPNPFNPITTIEYNIPSNFIIQKIDLKSEKSNTVIQSGVEGFSIQLIVYDVLGREISTLVNQPQKPGKYSVQFDGSNLSSGNYYYRLKTDNYVETKGMTLIK